MALIRWRVNDRAFLSASGGDGRGRRDELRGVRRAERRRRGDGVTLPADVTRWPQRWADDLREREAIMLDAGVVDAKGKAEADVRRVAEASGRD